MFKNKVIVVTGSSAGIGAGTAIKFAQDGAAAVVLHGRQEAALKNVKEKCEKAGKGGTKVHIIAGDITDQKVRERLISETIDQFGRLDVLVNNAGIASLPRPTSESPIEDFDKIFDVNLRSVIVLTQLAVPHLVKVKGNIVNISSVGGIKARTLFAFYGMSKAAMDHFTRCLAVELGPKGVRVNSVNPSVIPETELASRYGASDAQVFKENVENKVSATPLRRPGTVEEVADLITFLASDKAAFITGTRAVVDGGLTVP